MKVYVKVSYLFCFLCGGGVEAHLKSPTKEEREKKRRKTGGINYHKKKNRQKNITIEEKERGREREMK